MSSCIGFIWKNVLNPAVEKKKKDEDWEVIAGDLKKKNSDSLVLHFEDINMTHRCIIDLAFICSPGS